MVYEYIVHYKTLIHLGQHFMNLISLDTTIGSSLHIHIVEQTVQMVEHKNMSVLFGEA
jgi:hypothetical protein